MARLVRFRGKGPIPVGDPPVAVCACGLSKTFPFCSGAHIKIQDEDDDETYVYDRRGRRVGKVFKIKMEEDLDVEDIYSPI